MKLVDLLTPERIVIPLEADTLQEAATRLAERIVASGAAPEASAFEATVADLLPAEAVTVAQQAFLLHFRTDAVRHLVGALGVAPAPVQRDEDSARGARIVALLAAPHKESSAYLQAVSAFARAMSHEDVVRGLLEAKSAADVQRLVPFADVSLPGYLTVRDVLGTRHLSVRPDATLGEAVRLMVAHRVPALPVVSESGEVLGMVTHREVLRFLLPSYVKKVNTGEVPAVSRKPGRAMGDPHGVLVKEAMDRSVLCLSEDQTLGDVAAMMINKDVEQFPVVREGALVGMLTRSDIVRRLFGP